MNAEKLKKLGASVRTGGKGSVRRKKLVRRGGGKASDNALNLALKRLQLNGLSVDEVKLFNKDGNVTVFNRPMVSANIQANTVVVKGASQTRPLSQADMSDVITPNIEQLLKQYQAQSGNTGAGAANDVPELEGDFEQAIDAEAESKPAEAQA